MFRFFGCEACSSIAPPSESEPTSPALVGDVRTTGPPGKSSCVYLKMTNSTILLCSK